MQWSRTVRIVVLPSITVLLGACMGNAPAMPDLAQPPDQQAYIFDMSPAEREQAWARFDAADRAEAEYKMRLYRSGREVSFANGGVSMTWNRHAQIAYITFTQRVVDSFGLENAIMAFQTDAEGNLLRRCGGDGCLTRPLLAHVSSFRTAEGEVVQGIMGILGSAAQGMGAAAVAGGGGGITNIAQSGASASATNQVQTDVSVGDCEACGLLRRNQ